MKRVERIIKLASDEWQKQYGHLNPDCETALLAQVPAMNLYEAGYRQALSDVVKLVQGYTGLEPLEKEIRTLASEEDPG